MPILYVLYYEEKETTEYSKFFKKNGKKRRPQIPAFLWRQFNFAIVLFVQNKK
jgi:hypothetical protein